MWKGDLLRISKALVCGRSGYSLIFEVQIFIKGENVILGC